MDDQLKQLIQRANDIIAINGTGTGLRYPQELKTIVCTHSKDYGMGVRQICKHIPISPFSAREWPKLPKDKFKKVIVKPPTVVSTKEATPVNNKFIEYQIFLISAQALLITVQIFFD